MKDTPWQQPNTTLLTIPAQDFPFLNLRPALIFLDNASTTQKPARVLTRMQELYSGGCANLGRGLYPLELKLASAYQQARVVVQHFIQAGSWRDIIFMHSTTDAINAVMYAIAHLFQPRDAILMTVIEHTSNTLPWLHLARQRDLDVAFVKINPDGSLRDIRPYLTQRTKLVTLNQCSHVLGRANPLETIIQQIRDYNNEILILVDGAQAVTHLTINVQRMDCDFFVFSGHKLYAPSGTGVLYVKAKVQPALQFYRLGGGMIDSFEQMTTLTMESLQSQMETGSLNTIGSICLAEALQYLETFSLERIHAFYQYLNDTLKHELLQAFADVQIVSQESTSLVSFYFKDYASSDIGMMLGEVGICVRTGHLCSYPLLRTLNLPPLIRVSFGLYNTLSDIQQLIAALKQIISILQ